MTTDYQPIRCELHDYLEIACMRGYLVDIELLDGRQLQAKAITTHTTPDRSEWLEVTQDQTRQKIRLDQIHAITPDSSQAGAFARIQLNPLKSGQ